MKEYTKRDSCMTMEEVIERNTGMSLKAFLTPQPNPYIHNMDRAVYFFKKKVNDAAEKKEILQIKIVGDYDADGMNASAILYDAIISYLKANSLAEYAEVSVRLPRRYSEGYGLSEKIIDESESGLIITVDNGIAAIDAIKKAKDKGIDVIILDHHLGGEKLPCADIIVDPHCEGMSTFKHYCGAGLAYRFAEMLITNKDLLDKLLVLAGIATVADVVPLIGANRYLVRQSLKLINRGIATSGVLALVRKMRLEKITAEDYGYKIGPVCNASGRLLDDGAMDIFHLLSQELDVFALDYDEQLLKLHSLADTVIERKEEAQKDTESQKNTSASTKTTPTPTKSVPKSSSTSTPAPTKKPSTPATTAAPTKAPTATPAPTKAPHEHNWVEQYTTVNIPAKTHTVHHDAVYQTIHHDAVTHEEPIYEYHQVCNVCGEDFGYGPDAIEAVGDHSAVTDHSYSSQKVCVGSTTVTDQDAYDEQRLVSEAYDETIVDEQARTEQRLTGYKCSGCGATKN